MPAPSTHAPRVLAFALAGAVFGASSAWGGFYASGRWGALAIVAALAVTAPILTRSACLDRWSALTVTGLAALTVLSLLSTGWADSSDAALTAGCRWGLYTALFALAATARPGRRELRSFLIGLCAATVVVGLVICVRLLGGSFETLFERGRLYQPLGYANGLALALTLPLWPLVAWSTARTAPPFARGTALAGATLLAGVAVLAQSRGALVAMATAAIVLLVPSGGRARRFWALALVTGAVLAILPALLEVYSAAVGPEKAVRSGDAHAAGIAALLAAAGAGLAWTAATGALRLLGPRLGDPVRRAAAIVPVILCAAAVFTALTATPRIADEARAQWHAFAQTDRPETGTTSRFTASGSQRREYWRVALLEFRERPALGWGAGNFGARWFALRRIDEDVRQPHSLPLQTLAELGVAGGVALLLAIVGLVGGLISALRRVGPTPTVVAAIAACAAWLAAASIDWIALLPGITGAVAVIAGLVLSSGRRPARVGRRWPRVPVITVSLLGAALLVALTARVMLTDRWTDEAGAHLRDGRPAQALTLARRVERLQPDRLQSLYVQAAAYALGNRYGDARAALLRAARRAPRDFVPHVLLGDLATRRGDDGAARREYATAARLNPRGVAIARASRDAGPVKDDR